MSEEVQTGTRRGDSVFIWFRCYLSNNIMSCVEVGTLKCEWDSVKNKENRSQVQLSY